MAIEDTFDFAARSINGALGDTVTWRPDTASEAEVKATFGNGFQRVEGGGVRVSTRRPEITVALSDLDEDPEEGFELDIRGTRFEVATIQPDVEAVSVTLVLKKA